LRVTLSKGAPKLTVGDRLLVLAEPVAALGTGGAGCLRFPAGRLVPAARRVGYALAPAAVIEPGKPSGLVRVIDSLRADITERIMKALPGPEGGVVAALLTGEQTAVDKDIAQAMRDSGLAHILSISGLHIVFVVGLVMGLIRYGIALVPPWRCGSTPRRSPPSSRWRRHCSTPRWPAPRCRRSGPARWRHSRCSRCCSTARRCRSGWSPGRR
jgi:competence protein ComEC